MKRGVTFNFRPNTTNFRPLQLAKMRFLYVLLYYNDIFTPTSDYGVDTPDASKVPRGPTFTQQPVNVVFNVPQFDTVNVNQVALECVAEGQPAPTYTWYKDRGVPIKLDSEVDSR